VAVRRRQIELSVERPLGGRAAGSVARLTATFESGGSGEGPTGDELARALEELVREMDAAVDPSLLPQGQGEPDRGLEELVETYRPRQRELVDALLGDGEITKGEHARLLTSLGALPAAARPAAVASRDTAVLGETPIAAAPISAEPKLPPARPVPELLRTFQITNLRQAGAVRARRQISFAEYMALKRHFEAESPPTAARGTPGGPA
jgi:hypothetical protein